MVLSHAITWFGLLLTGQQQPPTPVDPALKQELARLQGSWQLDSMEENGKKASADELKERKLLFIGDALVLRGPESFRQTCVLKLGLAKKPKTLNAAIMVGRDRGTTMLGIYELDGDTMKICVDTQGEERAKDFTAPAGSNRQLLVCKRIRLKDEDVELPGTYRSVSIAFDGSEHVAEAMIERVGDAYLVKYTKGGMLAYVGVALRNGNSFCMSWGHPQVQAGVTLYRIDPGPRLVGQYTQYSQNSAPGVLESEVLTRIEGK